MAAITQPSAFGSHSGRRYGSFANKTVVVGQQIGLWHTLGVTSYDTNTSGYDTVPFVIRNTDQAQVLTANIDPT